MLVSIKLLFAMIDHHAKDDQQTIVRDDQRMFPDVPDVPGTVRQTGQDDRDDKRRSGAVPAERTNALTRSAPDPSKTDAAGRAAPVDIGSVAHLIPAARAARATLAKEGRSLSRDNLADAMRDDGHGVSNQRASLLVKILKAEQEPATIGPTSVRSGPEKLDPVSELVA